MLRALLVASFFTCAGCGPYCLGSGGGYYVTIRSSLGMLPSDLFIVFGGMSKDEVVQANTLSTTPGPGGSRTFWCKIVGPDGGTAAVTLSTATSIVCTAAYGADVTVSITGTGIKPFRAQLHNGTQCQEGEITADYVLMAPGP
jgi:hypothetical protein